MQPVHCSGHLHWSKLARWRKKRMNADEAWDFEQQLWLEGPQAYYELINRECGMAYPYRSEA
jgi:hypothetical protein